MSDTPTAPSIVDLNARTAELRRTLGTVLHPFLDVGDGREEAIDDVLAWARRIRSDLYLGTTIHVDVPVPREDLDKIVVRAHHGEPAMTLRDVLVDACSEAFAVVLATYRVPT